MDTVEVAGAAASLVELAHMREGVYRMFSSLYFKELTDEQIRFFANEGLPMLEGVEGPVGQGARMARKALRRVTSATREDLAVDYAHTFLAAGSTKEEQRACPFESVFTSRAGLMMQEGRDQVYKMMLDEHLQPDVALHVPEDHLSFEFDFMADMSARMADAVQEGEFAEAARLLEVQRAFHRDHQLNWIDRYCDAVRGCCRTDFYRGVADITCGFVHMEDELLAECDRLLAQAREEGGAASAA